MAKRKSDASPTSPRKKAKLDQPTDTPILQTFNAHAASSSLSSSSSPATPQRREKRKRIDSTTIEDLDEEPNPSVNAKRAKTQSPANATRHSRSPSFEPWPSHYDDPQSQAHIYWEDEHYTKELTNTARRFRRAATLALNGYLMCSCGKYHYMDGRKGYHYPGREPELESSDEAEAQLETVSAYQSQSREPLLSPELSDEEADTGDDDGQLESAPLDVSIPQPPLTTSASPVPIIPEASIVSPATSPTILPTTNKARVSHQRNNAKRNAEIPNSQRQTRRKSKSKKEKENKGKTGQPRQPRNRKSKTVSAVEEPVHSRRSSRRDVGSQLWFLGDNGKACLVTPSLS
ncbi:hypothetical protein ACHAQJ_005124 [Trichoderma viride]